MIEEAKHQATLTDIWSCPGLRKQNLPFISSQYHLSEEDPLFTSEGEKYFSFLSHLSSCSASPSYAYIIGVYSSLVVNMINVTIKHYFCTSFSTNMIPGKVLWLTKWKTQLLLQIVTSWMRFGSVCWFNCNMMTAVLHWFYMLIMLYLLLSYQHHHVLFTLYLVIPHAKQLVHTIPRNNNFFSNFHKRSRI